MHFQEGPSTRLSQGYAMHICTVIKEKVNSLQIGRNNYVFRRDIDDDSDWAQLTSFGIDFQT